MELFAWLDFFTPSDAAAVGLLVLMWLGTGYRIENAPQSKASVSMIMARYRREWMVQFITRQPRIFDATILGNLRAGTTFFASACMIGIGGGLALIGNQEKLEDVAQNLSLDSAPALVWEIKILVVILFLANGFLKFVWSHRLFGYCAVVMASVPNDIDDPLALPRAGQAAEINITGARSFNRGLRSVYFALGAMAWMLGPIPLLAATLFTGFVLWRREFASHSRKVLLDDPLADFIKSKGLTRDDLPKATPQD